MGVLPGMKKKIKAVSLGYCPVTESREPGAFAELGGQIVVFE